MIEVYMDCYRADKTRMIILVLDPFFSRSPCRRKDLPNPSGHGDFAKTLLSSESIPVYRMAYPMGPTIPILFLL